MLKMSLSTLLSRNQGETYDVYSGLSSSAVAFKFNFLSPSLTGMEPEL